MQTDFLKYSVSVVQNLYLLALYTQNKLYFTYEIKPEQNYPTSKILNLV